MAMFRESAARPRPTPRLLIIGGLLVLIGVTAGAVAAPEVGPAHPPAPAAPLATRPLEAPASVPDAVGPSEPGGSVDTGVPADGPAAALSATGPRPRPEPVDLSRSLVLSGLVGLTISLVGLVLVGHRRRLW
ncbi:hypothetical protein [Micromonospora echinofusca]|uniref:Uncharacterized protein n=1 Tax=Micromonospora echinofusca TaxID=47858 RepID=A0ABS3VJC7_MICEH|nr:hypothetical protein [Micromonospora echinofusca]MBO4204558.1 hypothetical protein [Micromonospora echinofusca]